MNNVEQLILTPDYLASQGLSSTFPERFWSKVDKFGSTPKHAPLLGPCWNWIGCLRNGYGAIGMGIMRNKTMDAHRASWIINRGPIAEGKWILHHCDNKRCVNPEHLYEGTPAENSEDSKERGLSKGPKCERHPKAKLTRLLIEKARSLREQGFYYREIAPEFGVDESTLRKACCGKTWT